jgi:membrane protease YdiL (CAAX protease family)
MEWRKHSLEPKNLVAFFGIAFGWTWLYWSLFIFQIIKLPAGIGTPNVSLSEILVYVPIVIFSPYGPTFAAFILTYLNEGKASAKELWKQSWNRNVQVKWLIVVFLWYPALNLLYRLISTLAFNVPQPSLQWLSSPITIIIPFIASILNGGLSEEIGWRGYALPRLQARFNAVDSSIILGFMEGLWHVPLVFWVGDSRYGMSIPLLILWQMIATFNRTWIFNNTGGSIFAAILFHAMGNTAGYIITFNLARIEWLPATKFVSPFLLILSVMVVIGLVLVFGYKTMSRTHTRDDDSL